VFPRRLIELARWRDRFAREERVVDPRASVEGDELVGGEMPLNPLDQGVLAVLGDVAEKDVADR